MPPKFFITHSWKDIEFARRLCNDLLANGLDGFFDERSVRPGESIPSRIEHGLENCDVYIPVFSLDALISPWCDWEIDMAIFMNREQGRPHIIPVIAEKCDVPRRLRHLLYVNFVSRYDEAFKELLTKGFGTVETHKGQTDGTLPAETNPLPKQPGVQQPVSEVSQVPIIISAEVSPKSVTGGGVVKLQVRVRSQAPVNWLNVSLDGPRGNLYGGGGTHNFREVSTEIWESEWKYDLSKWAPSGIYTFSNISVKNETELTSPAWDEISFEVSTPPTPKVVMIPPPTTQTLPRTKIGRDGKEMILIPAGEFVMGDGASNAPAHKVYLDAFYLSRFPVTNTEYKKFVDATKHAPPGRWSGGKIPQGQENHPVVGVTWNDAVDYCKWADARLPTEAEWEKAASWDEAKQEKRIYPWGKNFDASKCNTSESKIDDTTPVGKYSPQGDSAYDVSDLAGNVWEWCADWYDDNYYKNSPGRNPQGPDSGQYRVLRGGAFNNGANFVRAACRDGFDPDGRNWSRGFRVVAGAS